MFVIAREDVNGNHMKRILPIIEGGQRWNIWSEVLDDSEGLFIDTFLYFYFSKKNSLMVIITGKWG